MKLNLGCGQHIYPGWINADIQKSEGVDKSFDFNVFPYPFKKETFDYILVDNVLEHLDDCYKVIDELWRIAKPNATIEIRVPYCHNLVAFNDPGHKHFFNARSIELLCDVNSTYSLNPSKKFEIISLKKTSGRFKKIIPYKIRELLDNTFHGMFIEIITKIRVKKPSS